MTTRREFLGKAAVGGAVAVWAVPTIESLVVPAAALSACDSVTVTMFRDATDNKTWHFVVKNNSTTLTMPKVVVVNGGSLRVNGVTRESGNAFTTVPAAFPTTGSVTLNYGTPVPALGSSGFRFVNNSNNAFATALNITLGTVVRTVTMTGVGTVAVPEVVTSSC